jgi:hypothetical protein
MSLTFSVHLIALPQNSTILMNCCSMECKIVSDERVFPRSYLEHNPITRQISLVDSSVVNFGDCSAIWVFAQPRAGSAFECDHLREALRTALSQYFHFCGLLHLALYEPNRVQSQYRYGRIAVRTYSQDDPGVLLRFATTTSLVEDVVPSDRGQVWKRDAITYKALIPNDPLPAPLSPTPDHTASPLQIQLTTFACGGIAIAARLHHALADAHTLIHFVRDLASTYRSLLYWKEIRPLSPIFAPELLNSRACNIDAARPDTALIQKARALPFLRGDWYHKDAKSASIPDAISQLVSRTGPSGSAMPWQDWDVSAPVDHVVIHFSGEEVARLHTSLAQPSNGFVSHHDALLAHVWSGIVRARQLAYVETAQALIEEDKVHACISISLRPRARLDLGDAFIGSPIQIAAVALPVSDFAGHEMQASIASTIRTTLATLDRGALQAQVHSLAYEASPQRIWQAFLGRKHIIFTSWVKEGAYDVDFGHGQALWMEPVMNDMDGIVVACEASDRRQRERDYTKPIASNGKWFEHGVDVSIHLERKALQVLLEDKAFLRR